MYMAQACTQTVETEAEADIIALGMHLTYLVNTKRCECRRFYHKHARLYLTHTHAHSSAGVLLWLSVYNVNISGRL